jgi:type VI secretion system protein ImpJ
MDYLSMNASLESNSQVLWSEGMLLLPAHFNQTHRYLEHRLHVLMRALNPHAWGIEQLQINESLLSMGKIALVQCAGVFPDGTAVNIPADDVLPAPLVVDEDVKDCLVFLSLKHRLLDDFERYHVRDLEILAHPESQTESQTIQVACISTELMLADVAKRATDRVLLPITKIQSVNADGQIILDSDFIPSCLHIGAHHRLQSLIEEIRDLLQSRVNLLTERCRQTAAGRVVEMTDFALLQTMVRYASLFNYLIVQPNTHPAVVHQHATILRSELSCFDGGKPLTSLPPYQQQDLSQCFISLTQALRQALSQVLIQNSISIELKQNEYGLWTANINDTRLWQSASFILSAYAKVPLDKMRECIPNQIKIAPTSEIDQLASRSLSGIGIQALNLAPAGIPSHPDHAYFLLDKTHAYWPSLKKGTSIGIHLDGQYPDLQLSLWAIRRKGDDDAS